MKPITYHAIIGEHLHKNITLSQFTQKLSYLDSKLLGVTKLIQGHKLYRVTPAQQVPSLTEIDGKKGDMFLIKEIVDTKFELVLGKENLQRTINKFLSNVTACEYINYSQDVNDIEDVTTPKQLDRIQTLAEILSLMDEDGLTNDAHIMVEKEESNIVIDVEDKEESAITSYFKMKDEESNSADETKDIEEETKSDDSTSSENVGEQDSEAIYFEDEPEKDKSEDSENPIFKLEREVLGQK